MNCKEINENYSIVEYLSRIGIQPVKIKNQVYFYLSPFRKEFTASFKVDANINRYYDFGEGKGGGLVSLISRLEKIQVREIVYRYSNNNFSFQKLKTNISENIIQSKRIQILERKPLYSYILKSYLRERGIYSNKAYQYVEEIKFKIEKGSVQYALGFQNIDGNYEIRNKLFKGSTRKNLSIFLKNKLDKRVFIFEGFFDFLSFLEINNYPDFNYIILNSTANILKLIEYLDSENFNEIHLYLDNDLSGNNCTNEIISRYNSKVIDHRIEYKIFNDLNNFLIDSLK
ncbi:toprim domain-containing protein [Empedobacter falsenii]